MEMVHQETKFIVKLIFKYPNADTHTHTHTHTHWLRAHLVKILQREISIKHKSIVLIVKNLK